MKYIAIFQLENINSATAFDTKAAAEKYIKDCAKAANLTVKPVEQADHFTFNNQSEEVKNLQAHIEPVDTAIKYQLKYTQNGKTVETKLYDTREAAVKEANQIIDQHAYTATKDEDAMGEWSIDDLDQSIKIDLKAKLVIVNGEENVVNSYDTVDMKAFCADFEQNSAKAIATKQADSAKEIKDARKKGLINLCLGLGIAAVGGIMSLVSYNNAGPGEKYTIYTGIIAIGVVDAAFGAYYLINPKASIKKK